MSTEEDRTKVFGDRLRELDDIRIGGWRWLSWWRRRDRALREILRAALRKEEESGRP
jgi:hypothetical protein